MENIKKYYQKLMESYLTNKEQNETVIEGLLLENPVDFESIKLQIHNLTKIIFHIEYYRLMSENKTREANEYVENFKPFGNIKQELYEKYNIPT